MKLKLFTLLALSLPALAAKWDIDDSHTTAKFKIRHMMISNVTGQITGAKGEIDIDDKDNSKISGTVTLSVATINTANEKRDTHLKDADFFDVKKFPTITYKIGKVAKSGDKLTLDGDLTMKGVTKKVQVTDVTLTPTVKDPWGNTRRGLSGKAKLDRKDFGISWNKALDGGGIALGDEVEIEVDMELTAKK